jgi:hypothetical protein
MAVVTLPFVAILFVAESVPGQYRQAPSKA